VIVDRHSTARPAFALLAAAVLLVAGCG